MVGQDRGELGLVLRLQEILDRALRQLGERLVGRCENGEGPGPDSVSTSPAAWTAATSVLNDPAPIAVWTMFIDVALVAPFVPCRVCGRGGNGEREERCREGQHEDGVLEFHRICLLVNFDGSCLWTCRTDSCSNMSIASRRAYGGGQAASGAGWPSADGLIGGREPNEGVDERLRPLSGPRRVATRSNLNRPTNPQFTPPTTRRTANTTSRVFMSPFPSFLSPVISELGMTSSIYPRRWMRGRAEGLWLFMICSKDIFQQILNQLKFIWRQENRVMIR